jgi:hypothetical protein
MNKGHIYFTDNEIKVKCISNTDKDNKKHLIDIGNIYTANSTTYTNSPSNKDKYYFINETKTAMPTELFITIDELREQTINQILK